MQSHVEKSTACAHRPAKAWDPGILGCTRHNRPVQFRFQGFSHGLTLLRLSGEGRVPSEPLRIQEEVVNPC